MPSEPSAVLVAPEHWARMDPTFVLEHLRRTTVFDVELVEAMMAFAIAAAAAGPGAVLVPRDTLRRVVAESDMWLNAFGEPSDPDYSAAYTDLLPLLAGGS